MQGNPEILDVLNEVLTAELTAINQYFLHAKIMEDWGFDRLAAHTRHESIDEMKHAEIVTDRILFLDGLPNYQRYFPLKIGETVPEMFDADLELEFAAVERLNRGIALARDVGDNGSRELFEQILVSEEEHIDWLETQLESIRQVGLENYLAEHLHRHDD
jgi:bacterioferritin